MDSWAEPQYRALVTSGRRSVKKRIPLERSFRCLRFAMNRALDHVDGIERARPCAEGHSQCRRGHRPARPPSSQPWASGLSNRVKFGASSAPPAPRAAPGIDGPAGAVAGRWAGHWPTRQQPRPPPRGEPDVTALPNKEPGRPSRQGSGITEGRVRTLGGTRYASFQIGCIRPLCHLSWNRHRGHLGEARILAQGSCRPWPQPRSSWTPAGRTAAQPECRMLPSACWWFSSTATSVRHHGRAGAIERVHQFVLALGIAIAGLHATGLERPQFRHELISR